MSDLDILKTRFDSHCTEHNREMASISGTIKAIQKEVGLIKDNHLAHLKLDIQDLKVSQAIHGTKIDNMQKVQWFLVTTGALTLIGIVVNTYLTLR